jgi:hypothetical protein
VDFFTDELYEATASEESEEECSTDLELRFIRSATWLELMQSVMRHRVATDELPRKPLRDPIVFTLVFPQNAEDPAA